MSAGRLLTDQTPAKLWAGLEALHREGVSPEVWGRLGSNPEFARVVARKLADIHSRFLVPLSWKQFYGDVFGVPVDVFALFIPEAPLGFMFPIIVIPGITIERVLSAMQNHFPVRRWTSENLDAITTNDRSAKSGPYAVWVRGGSEADLELEGKSYNDLKAAGIAGITLLEYLLYHLKHFLETDEHLNARTIALCSGSSSRDGTVSASWSPGSGGFCVDWCNRAEHLSYLRPRQVVA